MAMEVIRFEQVSKKYTLRSERPRTVQEMAVGLFRGLNSRREEIWALRDLSFEVKPGEALGIIGPNGAGKSTILKLIVRVLEPSWGKITVNGRAASLLELGPGFHPDLSGRENIYLAGSIHGLSRRAIRAKFDRIVEFSGLSRFIDTPVKHYSSGMQMRLGFSIAISLDADILAIDEVLAVGDLEFQRKCLEAMQCFKKQGKTIIFVSHDLYLVRRFCDQALLLHNGEKIALGHADDVTTAYLYAGVDGAKAFVEKSKTSEMPQEERVNICGGLPLIKSVRFKDREGRERQVFMANEPMEVEVRFWLEKEAENFVVGLDFFDDKGTALLRTTTFLDNYDTKPNMEKGVINFKIPSLPINQGTVYVTVCLVDKVTVTGDGTYEYHAIDVIDRQYHFTVTTTAHASGLIHFPYQWG